MLLLVGTLCVFTSCKEEDEPAGGPAATSAISELAVTPNADVKYGDEVTLTAKFADEKGLRQYMISVSNANGSFYETTKMLTGKTYDLNEKIALPLPKNAVPGDLTISVTVKNSSNQLSTEEVSITGVTLPTFDALYLALDKSTDIAIYLIFRTRLHRLSALKNRWLVFLLVGSAFAYGVTQYLMNAILSRDIHTMRQASIVSFLVLLLFFLVFSLLLLTISARDQERAQRLVLQQTDRLMEKNYQMLLLL